MARLEPFREPALHSAFVTCLALIAYSLGVFARVDTFLFSKASEILAFVSPRTTPQSLIVEIDQDAFDTRFDGTTPLNRGSMGDLIAALAAKDRYLAIDLDLSPRGESLKRFAELPDELTCARLTDDWRLEKALCAAQGKIVLLLPFPSDGSDAIEKFRWMQLVCSQGNVEFAWPDVPAPVGPYAVQYFYGGRALGRAASAVGDGFCAEAMSFTNGRSTRLPVQFAFLDRAVVRAGLAEKTSLGKARYLRFAQKVPRVLLSSCATDYGHCVAAVERDAGRGATIFVGGTWDSSGADEFGSPLGRIPGVLLHALAREHYVTYAFAFAPILEFVVGIGLFIWFRRLWEKADSKLRAFAGAQGTRARCYAGLVYVLRMLVVPLAVGAATLVALALVAALLSTYVWMAPAALIAGIAVDSYREKPHEPSAGAEALETILARDRAAWWLAHVPHAAVVVAGIAVYLTKLWE